MAREGKVFYGWWIVAATFIVLLIGLSSGFYTVSVFLEPLRQTFGWSATRVSIGFTLAALLVGLLSPVVGVAVARFGVKKVQLYGATTIGLALLMLGSMQQLWHYCALLIFMATGAILLGRMYDASGSYSGAVQVLLAVAVLGTIAATLIVDPARPKTSVAQG
jgi:cyanate permease